MVLLGSQESFPASRGNWGLQCPSKSICDPLWSLAGGSYTGIPPQAQTEMLNFGNTSQLCHRIV